MLSYSPYDNVAAVAYPNLLVTSGLHDSQVQYFEPTKWVAGYATRLRATDDRRQPDPAEDEHGSRPRRRRRPLPAVARDRIQLRVPARPRRPDVDGGQPYSIPPGNPYVGEADARPEVWAIGLRNPWRFAFDGEGGMLYIADVGQSRREEINVQPAAVPGLNYGWNIMEGSLCYPAGSVCSPGGLVLPAVEYPNPDEGCAVTGGYVYRGADIPSLRGHYLYADFCRGRVRSFRFVGGAVTDHRDWDLGDLGRITSFGQDGAGELYILSQDGRVHRIRPAP
jgi:glucose/arabinose dehydrogenase